MSSQTKSMSESVVADMPMRIESSKSHRILIVVGLAVWVLLGLAANFLPAGPSQNIPFVLSSLGIIMGGPFLVVWFARRGHTIVAVGFALLALAESMSLPGLFLLASAPTFPSAYTFAAGVTLYAVALPLASVPPAFPIWTRIAGTLAAIPFAAHGLLWLLGRSPDTSGPLASIGYVVLAVAVVGWIITIQRAASSPQA